MAKFGVADVVKDATDFNGVPIQTVYSKIDQTYAIYRTEERVVVQFADDPRLGSEQRQALAPLNPTRGEINGLIDGWRASNDAVEKSKAKLFDRRVADALGVALQGDAPHAADILTGVKADILEERTSLARTQYLLVAFGATVFIVLACGVLAKFAPASDESSLIAPWLFISVSLGAIGALFSVAVTIRDRSVRTDLQSRDNAVDASLRVLIGAISAAVLICLFRAQLVTLALNGNPIDVGANVDASGNAGAAKGLISYALIVIAFAAGFAEQLMGDLLTRTVSSAIGPAANPLAGKDSKASGGIAGENADEHNPRGKIPIRPDKPGAADGSDAHSHDSDEDADADAAETGILPDEVTDDTELPEASGGVEKPASP